jgi:serine/threonine protein kinase
MYEGTAAPPKAPAQAANVARDLGTESPEDDGRIDAAQLLVGQRVGDRYELVKLLAVGAVGQVYEARQMALSRPVALKLIQLPEDDSRAAALRARFKLEAETLARLAHPNIVSIFDVGTWRGQGFIVMELLQGRTLSETLRKTRRMPLGRLIPIARQICQALDVTHRAGIIHRDLKPSNILLTWFSDQEDHVKLIDFGVAKDLQSNIDLTNQGTLIGTPRYMSPEQITCAADEVGPAADIYSLGAIMYRAALGKGVFPNAPGMSQLIAHVREAPPTFSEALEGHGLPPAFEQLVLRCLAKKPEDRFPSARALDQALAAIEEHLTPADHLVPVTPSPSNAGSLMAHERTIMTLSSLNELSSAELIEEPEVNYRSHKPLIAGAVALGALLGLAFVLRGGPSAPPEPTHLATAAAELRVEDLPPAAPAEAPAEEPAAKPAEGAVPAEATAPAAAPKTVRPTPKQDPPKAAAKPTKPAPERAPARPASAPRAEAPAEAPARAEAPKPAPRTSTTDLKDPWAR